MQVAARRPRILTGAEKPDCVRSQAGGLGWARDKDRSVLRFGREERLRQSAIQLREEILPRDVTPIEPQRAAQIDYLLQALRCLELRARSEAFAWPADVFQQLRREFRPFERAAVSLRC